MEEEEEEEGLYLRTETRKRVQTNEAKSKRRRASPTKTTGRRDNTPASRCLPSRRVLLARKGYRRPITTPRLTGVEGASQKVALPGPPTPTVLRANPAREEEEEEEFFNQGGGGGGEKFNHRS